MVIFEMLTHLHPLSKLLIIYQVPGISQNEISLYTSTDIYFMFGHALSHASHRPSPSPPWAPAAWQRDSAQHVQRQPMTGRHWQHFTMTWASNDFHFHLFMRSKIHYFLLHVFSSSVWTFVGVKTFFFRVSGCPITSSAFLGIVFI